MVAKPGERREMPRGRGEHILYVDDEEALGLLASGLLVRLGYRVSTFTRPDEALRAFAADPSAFDLVVTDMNMPGRSGIEVAAAMLKIRPDVPVVISSGFVTEELEKKALAAGVLELLCKPSTVEEFADAIHKTLTRVHVSQGAHPQVAPSNSPPRADEAGRS